MNDDNLFEEEDLIFEVCDGIKKEGGHRVSGCLVVVDQEIAQLADGITKARVFLQRLTKRRAARCHHLLHHLMGHLQRHHLSPTPPTHH